MDNVTVLFIGLIAHVFTATGVQRAVFVAAPEHDALIVVAAADVMAVSGLREESPQRDGERAFVIAGNHLSLGAGPAPQIDRSFRTHVLRLSTITDATALRDEIDQGILYDGVSAYLDLFDGALSAGDSQYARTSFGDSRRAECISRTVKFVAPAENGVAVFHAETGFLRVRAGATVRVENLPPPTYQMPHFHMYSLLMKDATYIAAPHQSGTCGTVSSDPRHLTVGPTALRSAPNIYTQVDCSSSQWP